MIPIGTYEKELTDYYVKKAKEVVDQSYRNRIIKNSKKYLPHGFYKSGDHFKELLLLPYERIKEAYTHIQKVTLAEMKNQSIKVFTGKDGKIRERPNNFYKNYHDAYGSLVYSERNKTKLNVEIIKATGLMTCPYCNRDYINCRKEHQSGGQLDHFYSRSKYPIFSISLYNMVPVCGNCNRIKSAKDENLISPFDQTIDFDKSVEFSYSLRSGYKYGINVAGSNGLENNIDAMSIEEAYSIHGVDVERLIEKRQVYTELDCDHISKALSSLCVTEADIKEAIFGVQKSVDTYGKEPLSKFKNDILKQMKVY